MLLTLSTELISKIPPLSNRSWMTSISFLSDALWSGVSPHCNNMYFINITLLATTHKIYLYHYCFLMLEWCTTKHKITSYMQLKQKTRGRAITHPSVINCYFTTFCAVYSNSKKCLHEILITLAYVIALVHYKASYI